MQSKVAIFIVILFIMFTIGIVMSIFTLYCNKNKKYPILVIILSIILLPLMYIPMFFILGFISHYLFILIIIYSFLMILKAIKNIKGNR